MMCKTSIENYKALLRNFKDQNKWREISCSYIRIFNILKMLFTAQFIYGFNAIPIRILKCFSIIFFIVFALACLIFW